MNRYLKLSGLVLLSVAAVTVVSVWAYYMANRPPRDVRAFQTLLHEATVANSRMFKSLNKKTSAQRAGILEQHRSDNAQLAARFLLEAQQYPNTAGELAALACSISLASDSEVGEEAKKIIELRSESPNLDHFGHAFLIAQSHIDGTFQVAIPGLLREIEQDPGNEQAAYLLSQICRISKGSPHHKHPGQYFKVAADLIADRYPSSPDIEAFGASIWSTNSVPRWAGNYEDHLRTILNSNNDRSVRCATMAALAALVRSSEKPRHAEATQIYQEFVDEFDGTYEYAYQSIEKLHRQEALRVLAKTAPE